MNERQIGRYFGVRLGAVSGLFALVQVAISVLAARGNGDYVASLRRVLDTYSGGFVYNPLPLIGPLLTVVVATSAASVLTGIICLGFCWYAGRTTAFVLGRRAGGAHAGFMTMLISSLIWVVGSLVVTLLLRADGSISGIFTSAFAGGNLTVELLALLVQELLVALIGLGFGALAGRIGASRAPVPRVPTGTVIYPNPYGVPYAALPPAPQGWMPYPPTYPPSPGYYAPNPPPQPNNPPQ